MEGLLPERLRTVLAVGAVDGLALEDAESDRRWLAGPASPSSPELDDALAAAPDALLLALGAAEDDPSRAVASWLARLRQWLREEPARWLLILGAESERSDGTRRDAVVAELGAARCIVRREVDLGGTTLPWFLAPPPGAHWLLTAQARPLRYRRVRPGDEPALSRLFERCFHLPRPERVWRWRYREGPLPEASRHCLAETADGEAVAHYGAFPLPLFDPVGGRSVSANQIGDVMTAPEVRGMGRGPTSPLAQTARQFHAQCTRRQAAFIYGFYTATARAFQVRYAAGAVAEPVPYRVLQRDRLPVASGGRWRRRPEIREIAPDALDGWAPALDRLYGEARRHYGLHVVRDARLLRWRVGERPDREDLLLGATRGDRLLGWSVFHAEGEELRWGDAWFLARHAGLARDLLAAALERHPAARRVVGWFPQRPTWWHRRLERLGFERQTEPNELDLGLRAIDGYDTMEALVARLYYTWADSDLF